MRNTLTPSRIIGVCALALVFAGGVFACAEAPTPTTTLEVVPESEGRLDRGPVAEDIERHLRTLNDGELSARGSLFLEFIQSEGAVLDLLEWQKAEARDRQDGLVFYPDETLDERPVSPIPEIVGLGVGLGGSPPPPKPR